jgi:FkbM family methyltransferase
MVSYAQNFEDVLLQRVFADTSSGFYIDVGAADPVVDSVTKHFYERGWQGINIEPLTHSYRALCADRPRDRNLNVGLSNVEKTLTFYETPSQPQWSTLSKVLSENFRRAGVPVVERSIPVTTLARVCVQYVDRPIDFLKIDVEGCERDVLEGADWKRWRPRVLVIETNNYRDWEPLLLGADYLFALYEGINRFYVRAEDRHLLPILSTPANCMDQFEIHRYVRQIQDLQRKFRVPLWVGRKVRRVCSMLGRGPAVMGRWVGRLRRVE